MMKKKITLEYCSQLAHEEKKVPLKGAAKKAAVSMSHRLYTTKRIPKKNPEAWSVVTVENSTAYTPDAYLSEREVNKLCASPQWNVIIASRGHWNKDRY